MPYAATTPAQAPAPEMAAILRADMPTQEKARAILDNAAATRQIQELSGNPLSGYQAQQLTQVSNMLSDPSVVYDLQQAATGDIVEAKADFLGELATQAGKRDAAGGAYKDLAAKGGQIHHMPADSVSPYSKNRGPGIRMETKDHMETASWGRSKAAQAYRAKQKALIDSGRFREAQLMDVLDIRTKFGTKYDAAIREALVYTEKLLKNKE